MKQSLLYYLFFLCLLNSNAEANAQSSDGWKLTKSWESLGPNVIPINTGNKGANGIGPVEFVRVHPKVKGHLLAGSLTGGLFYSSNGGESWEESGSDDWAYSGCPWADFHPSDHETWFAVSHFSADNGKPGSIGVHGGVLRKKSGKSGWEPIGAYKDFGGSKYIRIYGTRFHPVNENMLFVLTSEGLYFTLDCLEKRVVWQRVPGIKGWVYDLDFIGGYAYFSNFFHGEWNVMRSELKRDSKVETLDDIHSTEKQRTLTIEPLGERLLIAKDFVKKNGQIEIYDPKNKSLELVSDGKRISFGSGHTFQVSPHDLSEFYFGESTKVIRLRTDGQRPEKLGRGYHPDVEFVAFDPFDSTKVYLATHGGVYRSTDNGESWHDRSNGLGIAEVMGMAVPSAQIAIGCYHDGSMIRIGEDWHTVNGGDGLMPLIHPDSNQIVYTSNQYVGGGLFVSKDTALTKNKNIHNLNAVKTPGWEIAAVLNKKNPSTLFFNFMERSGENKGNINILRTSNAFDKKSAEVISDFKASHGLEKYKVYGLYNSAVYTDALIAYVLDYQIDKEGKKKTVHRLFRTEEANSPADIVKESWYEVAHPRNTWIADVEIDGYDKYKIYLSYGNAEKERETIFGGKRIVYSLKYGIFGNHRLKRRIDISRDLPRDITGRHNLVYVRKGGGKLFIATRNGVYMAGKKVLKGKYFWQKVGKDLPHCKVYGLEYDEQTDQLFLGLFGRGVWRYQL